MRQIIHEYRSKLQYTVIGPYLGLMILVMLVGSFIAITLVADSWQERFNNQLGQVARNFTESFARREIGNIEFLGLVTFTAPNAQTGAPAVTSALAAGDAAGLDLAMRGLWQIAQTSDNVKADRLIVFDSSGQALLDWERTADNLSEPTRYLGTSLSGIPLIDAVLRGESMPIAGSDQPGDKYSGLLTFRNAAGQDNLHFFTVSPVYTTEGSSERLIGGLLVAQRTDSLIQDLQTRSQAGLSTIYDVVGIARATTVTGVDLAELNMSDRLIDQVAALNNPDLLATAGQRSGELDDPCLDIGNLSGRLVSPVTLVRLPACSVNTTSEIGDRQYQIVYAPLLIRGLQSGYFAVGLSTDFVTSAWSASRSAVIGITAALALLSVFVGWHVARQITRPLSNLVQAAEAVTSGDLERRSVVVEPNELGRLSSAFNQMTEHLLRLYTASRELNRTIEVAQVLQVASEAASAFVPATEAIALINEGDGLAIRSRAAIPPEFVRMAHELHPEPPLLAELTARDPQSLQLIPLSDPAARAAVGLAPQIQTAYAAPIFRQHELAGALLFVHPEPDAFNEANEQSLAVVANMAVAVLANAVLYGQVEREAKERQAILRSIGDGVIVCDPLGRITLMNHAAEQILQLPDWQATHPYFAELPFEPLTKSRELFGAVGADFRLGKRFINLTRAPVISEQGLTRGEVIVIHDVSLAVAVDQAKTDFIATISHELRTPLTVIRGFTELLMRGSGNDKPSPDQLDLLTQVRTRAVDMTSMVNNAILIADVESGRIGIDLQPIDLELVIGAALAPLRQGFESRGLKLNLELSPELPLVLADREHLRLALNQIFDNARRYTEQGEVTVCAEVHENAVRIAVRDTGPGIDPEVLPRLFKRFQRIEGNNSAQRGGGLGLAITRQLIELQGGSVSVSSTPGMGSTFTITLPQVHEQSLAVVPTNETTTAT
jgi:signal transduction histidine kinase